MIDKTLKCMKTIISFFLILMPSICFSQNKFSQISYYENSKRASDICGEIADSNTQAAIVSVDAILSQVDIKPNFILRACDSEEVNAFAYTLENQRYIMYNTEFMNKIYMKSDSYWGYVFVLAHEIGHHLKDHTVDAVLEDLGVGCNNCEFNRNQELEADNFAGFVLAKLGATLEQAQEGIYSLHKFRGGPLNYNDSKDSHPNTARRLNAVKIGYLRGEKERNKNLILDF